MTPLPRPLKTRFQPLRSGLLNLFKYQDQEFWYEKGRLLVRGNNGTGKSRVLALQLPFLFDGEISPRRVEPDGDSARQMAWHLLMDEQFDQRTGYTWIEFGRLDAKGAEHYLTLGCGMKAVRGGDNQPSRWYFITTQRIGDTLHLQEKNTPRSAERLAEVLGPEDFFTKTAKEYRAEVNRRLFGLSTGAYSALLDLLIRLRAPQLSKKLDEKSLFEALSNALPPLAPEVVEQVATSFKQLDDLRQRYGELQHLGDTLSQFRTAYQTYLQMALMRRVDAVISGNTRYDKAQSQVKSLHQTIESGEFRKTEAMAMVESTQNQLTASAANLETLRSRPEADSAKALDAAQRTANEKEEIFAQAKIRSMAAESALALRSEEQGQQTAVVEKLLAERSLLSQDALAKVDATGFAAEHGEIIPTMENWPQDAKGLSSLQQRHQRKAGDHLYRLEQMQVEEAKVSLAEHALQSAQSRQNQAQEQFDTVKAQAQQHQQAAVAEVTLIAEQYRSWQSGSTWLVMPPWSEIAGHFEDWLETDASDHRVLGSTLSTAWQAETEASAMAHAAIKTRRTQFQQELHLLQQAAEALAAAPAAPTLAKVRAEAETNRQGRPGAPFWQVCDFQSHLSPAQCSGLEAALEAAGLLDAWIWPDGQLSLPEMPVDTFFQIKPALTPALHRTLADVLRRDKNSPRAEEIPNQVLLQVLQSIGLEPGSGSHWVSATGAWQLGPLMGRGEKPMAEFLGARSREAAREKRQQQIDFEKGRLAQELDKLEQQTKEWDARKAAAKAEYTEAPKDDAIASALTLRTEARKNLQQVTARLDEEMQATQGKRKDLAAKRDELEQLARQLGYGAHLHRLHELRASWDPYALTMSKLWHKAEALATAAQHLQRSESAQRTAAEIQQTETALARNAETTAIESRQIFETLRSTLGVTINEYQTLLAEAREQKLTAEASVLAANKEVNEVEKQLSGLQSQLPNAEEKVSLADSERGTAIDSLRLVFDAGLFSEADERLGEIESSAWSATRSVAIARIISKTLPETDHEDAAWTQRLNVLDMRINDLRTNTGSACPIESQLISEGLTRVTCIYQGVRMRPTECLLAVERERETHNRLLAEEERKIIDRHLIAEVSLQLQQLIEQAQDRTRKINKEMETCATTLNVAMRLVWEPRSEEQHPSLPAVRKLLTMDHAIWTDEQRQTVGRFLHQLIQEERLKNPTAPAAEQLLTALDYRRWHSFAAERHQNGRWERLTRKRYGTGSGGEKALMLTIPQMAAASSHYTSAAPHAPRFILLDEAFAGMDKPTRGRCMGLLEAFDLDLLMTSEREHGAHATISGIAMYHLLADAEAVTATRWVWNGSQSSLAPVPDTPELRS